MVNKNKEYNFVKLDNQVKIKDYNVVIIDFGLFKKFGFKNNTFYAKNIEHFYLFEIKSLKEFDKFIFNNINEDFKIN